MKTSKRIFLTKTTANLLVLIASITPVMIAQTTDPVGQSSIRVKAIYEDNERPVRRAEIQLISEDVPRVYRRGVTDSRGEFSFKNVPAGQYKLSVGFPGATNGSSSFDRRNAVVVEVDGNSSTEQKVRVQRGGAITGKVTYSDGEPAVGAQISVFTKDGKRWHGATFVPAGAQTDDRGIYRIYPLPPGEYVIGVVEQSLVIEERDGGSMQTTGNKSLNPYYYGGAEHYTGATFIQLDQDREVNNINITLAERATYKIAGTVVAGGAPLVGAYLNLLPHDDGLAGQRSMASQGLSCETDKDGQWSFKDVPERSYDIEVHPTIEWIVARNSQDKNRHRFVGQQLLVTVAGADLSNIIFSLSEGGRVSGRVFVEGDKPLPRGRIALRSTRRRTQPDKDVGVQLEPSDMGLFVIEEVPAGEHFMTVEIWDRDYFVKSITWNDKDLLRQSLALREGNELKNVRIVLSRDVGRLAGQMLSGEGKKPLGSARFMLVPNDEFRWARSESFIFGYTDKQGAFKVTGAPGEYVLMMLRRNEEPAISPDYFKEHASGPRVTLKTGEQANVEIVVPAQ